MTERSAALRSAAGPRPICFTQDYLFVPVHGGLHWSLAVVCFPGASEASPVVRGDATVTEPVILHLDSLANAHNSSAQPLRSLSHLIHPWGFRACACPAQRSAAHR